MRVVERADDCGKTFELKLSADIWHNNSLVNEKMYDWASRTNKGKGWLSTTNLWGAIDNTRIRIIEVAGRARENFEKVEWEAKNSYMETKLDVLGGNDVIVEPNMQICNYMLGQKFIFGQLDDDSINKSMRFKEELEDIEFDYDMIADALVKDKNKRPECVQTIIEGTCEKLEYSFWNASEFVTKIY